MSINDSKAFQPFTTMRKNRLNIRNKLKNALPPVKKWQQYGFNILILITLVYLAFNRDMTLEFNFSTKDLREEVAALSHHEGAVNAAQMSALSVPTLSVANTSQEGQVKPLNVSQNTTTVTKPLSKAELEKRQRQLSYVQRFAQVAQAEMQKYGVPASITLAQGLVETNAGLSQLATKNHNHFGMKCFSKKCRKGHCSNFVDDSHKDFFRIYQTAWESFRAHSLMLKQSKRYQPLFRLHKKDYKAWAHGLRKAGYATDKRYAEKLIAIIEALELYQYDQ